MTLDEWIEFAETKAKEHRERYTTCADDPEWVKYGKIWEKEYQQLAEWLRALKEIWDSGDCNDCKRKDCEYRPRVGQLVRFNCMFYEEVNADGDSD